MVKWLSELERLAKRKERPQLPSGKKTSSQCLELYNDICQFEVSLLFKMGQHAGAEKDLALPDAEKVGVQL